MLCSQKTSLLPQKHEWALLGGRRVSQWGLREFARVPELEPLEVVGAMSDIVLITVMLEEERLVTPERWGGLGARHEPADVALWALVVAELGRAVVPVHSEHGGVLGHDLELLVEVILVLVSPPVDVIRLDIDLEGPVWVLLFLSKLIEFGKFHDRHGTSVVCDLGQVLSNGLTGAVVVHFFEDVRPAVPEEVEGRLTVEGKHGKPISGGHAIAEELNTVAWGGLGGLGSRLRELRDSHDAMLAASEDTSVGSVVSRDELNQCAGASWMGFLDSALGHRVRDRVERHVHILVEETLELVANKESLRRMVTVDALPDEVLFADGWKCLIVGRIELIVLFDFLNSWAVRFFLIMGAPVELLSLSCVHGGSQEGQGNCKLH